MKIEINLLPGGKKKKAGGAGFALPDISALITRIKDPLLIGAVAAWIVGLSVIGWAWYTQMDELEAKQPELLRLQNQARVFAQMIVQKGRQQELRDSLVLELNAIRGIDSDRFVWPHIMEEVTRALPEFTWVVALDAVEGQAQILDDGTTIAAPIQFAIDGRTSNVQSYTRFVSRLEDSPWFTAVSTSGITSIVESDRTVRAFQIIGTYQVADSAFIRTMPVAEMFVGGG